MNAHITNAVSHFLERALNPVTVADVCRLYDGGKHTKNVLDVVFGIPAETEIHRALKRLETLVERERSKGVQDHWSYDPNKHLALMMHANQLTKAMKLREAA